MTTTIELTRYDVTPAQFLAYVKANLKRRDIRDMASDLDLRYFAAGSDLNFDHKHDGIYERSVSKPYEMQTYIRQEDGRVYNEICEFQFHDDKTGVGYYYLRNDQ